MVWWFLREVGPQRMPKMPVIEKPKDQLSERKLPLVPREFFGRGFGVDAPRNPPTLSPPFA
jgi:hypothetical protein